jgi:hypothetical protein
MPTLPLLTRAELSSLLSVDVTLMGQSVIPLGPVTSCQAAADALAEVLDGLAEAYHDDFLGPDDPGGTDERRRLRALYLAVDLLNLLAPRA